MKKEDVHKIIEIINTADGGCSTCVGHLYRRFGYYFPKYKEYIVKEFKKEFNENLITDWDKWEEQ